jgi:phage-related tail protein
MKAALLACPEEKANAIAEYQKKPHDNTLTPSMTESERNEAELSRTFTLIKQRDQIATQSATTAIAEARSGSRH